MKFTLLPCPKKTVDCLLVGVFENGELTPAAKRLDKENRGHISKILKHGDIRGKIGDILTLYQLPNTQAERVILVGCGKNTKIKERDYRCIITASTRTINSSSAVSAFSYLTELDVDQRDMDWKIKQTVLVGSDVLYTFNHYKSDKAPESPIQEITLFLPEKSDAKSCQIALKQASAMAEGVAYTKDIANQPSNICTPTYLAEQAKKLAKEFKTLSVKILEEKDMKKLGMGALLAVSQGSDQPAKLICLEYKGSSKKMAPIALVGKGITFDTGGLSLKPADGMVGMKYDMCGAATVLGALRAAAELKLPINLVGVIAAAENMPSGKAIKPEDIVTTMSGQTVEILNTDAEGRLVLSDALTYCERYKPKSVIDIATLTGAVVAAFGFHATGLLTNYEPLAQELLAAGLETYDRAWQMPLWDEYQDLIRSPFADMTNTGGRMGGAISAACFLSRFTKKFHWAHLDVAGTAAMMMGGGDRYATGRPVPLLVQFLINQS